MGSPLGPALANIFMCNFENKWLKDCPHSLKPVFYRRYVDDIFVLFSSLVSSSLVLSIVFLFFVKKESLSLMFIEKRPSVVFILTSTASYLKPTKPV